MMSKYQVGNPGCENKETDILLAPTYSVSM